MPRVPEPRISQASIGSSLALVPFSRRAFFGLTAVVGSLTFLGTAGGGRVLAYADQEGSAFFAVYILSKEEVPIMAYDVSGGERTPLKGVSVTITSLLDGIPEADKSITVVTDELGFAPARIRKMSMQRDNDAATVYNFWGSIEAKLDTYREFAVHDYFVEAGTPAASDGSRPNIINIPTQPVKGEPYLRQFTLDGKDIQYSRGTEAAVWQGNDENHDLVAEIVTPAPNASVELAVLINGVQQASQTMASDASGHAVFTFTQPWCKDTAVGSSFSLKWSAGGKTWKFTSSMACVSPIMPQTATGEPDVQGRNIFFSPGTGSSGSWEKTTEYKKIPGWLSRKDDSLNVAFPMFPIDVFFDVRGRYGAAVTLLDIDFIKKHNGKDLLEGKKFACSLTGISENKMWATYKARQKELRENLGKAYGPANDPHLGGVSPAVSDKGMSLTLEFVSFGTATGEKGATTDRTLYTGDAAVRLTFKFSYVYTRQMQAMWMPFFVAFDFTFNAVAEFATGIKFYDKFQECDCHYSAGEGSGPNYDFVTYLRAEAGLTLGLGVSGIASAAARGFGYINWEFTFPCPARLPEGKKSPHSVITLGMNVQAVFQVFFFKKVYQVTHFNPRTLRDNWKSNEADDVLDAANLLDDDECEIGYEDFTVEDLVSDSDIAGADDKSVEATGSWVAESGTAGDACPMYGPVVSSVSMSNESFTCPCVYSPYEGDENYTYLEYNEVNGQKPVKQTKLHSSVFSNPRIRIVHTDTESFAQDRAFMVRVIAVQVPVPASTAAFGSVGEDGADATAYDLAIDTIDGNDFVEVTNAVSTLNASDAVATANARGSVTRTRLVVNEWDKVRGTWQNGTVVEFTCEGEIGSVDRLNSYDVDFDVDLHSGSLFIAITSLMRPKESYSDSSNASTIYLDYEKRQYISVVRFDIDKKVVAAAGTTFKQLATGLSLFHPHVLMQSFDEGDGKGATDHCMVYSYAADYAEDGGSRKSASLAVTVFDKMESGTSNHRFCPPTLISCDELSAHSADVLLEGNFTVSCPDSTKTVFDSTLNRYFSTVLIAWSHPKTRRKRQNLSQVFLQSFSVTKTVKAAEATAAEATADDQNAVEYTSSVKKHSMAQLDGVPAVAKLGRMKQRGVFCYPEAAKTVSSGTDESPEPRTLKMITADLDKLELATIENVGKTDKVRYFSSFNGRRLYCVRVMNTEDLRNEQGDANYEAFQNFGTPGMSEQAVEAVQGGGRFTTSDGPYNTPLKAADVSTSSKPVRMFQLLEARWVKELGTYYDFYPIAQVDFEPDNIGVIAASKRYTHFTFASLSKQGETADVIQVDVPVNLACKLYTAHPVLPFAAPGDTCWYSCEIANWGNAPITSITMKVTFGDGTEFEGSEVTFDDLSEYMLVAPEDVKPKTNDAGEYQLDENGLLETEEERDDIPLAGILWPGRRRAFKFWFKVPKIPEGQTGKKHTFKVRVSAVADKMEEAASRFPESSLVALDDGFDMPLLAEDDYVLGDGDEPFTASSILSATAKEFETDMTDEVTGEWEMDAAEYLVEGADESSTAAKTGDFGLLGLVGTTAIGAAAYGAMKYSERRMENEAACAAKADADA